MGRKTQVAIKAFEQDVGLPERGVPTAALLGRLEASLAVVKGPAPVEAPAAGAVPPAASPPTISSSAAPEVASAGYDTMTGINFGDALGAVQTLRSKYPSTYEAIWGRSLVDRADKKAELLVAARIATSLGDAGGGGALLKQLGMSSKDFMAKAMAATGETLVSGGARGLADVGASMAKDAAVDVAAAAITDTFFALAPQGESNGSLNAPMRAFVSSAIVEAYDAYEIFRSPTPANVMGKALDRYNDVVAIVEASKGLASVQAQALTATALNIESTVFFLLAYPGDKSEQIASSTLVQLNDSLVGAVGEDDADTVETMFRHAYDGMLAGMQGDSETAQSFANKVWNLGQTSGNITPFSGILNPVDYLVNVANWGKDAPEIAADIILNVTSLGDDDRGQSLLAGKRCPATGSTFEVTPSKPLCGFSLSQDSSLDFNGEQVVSELVVSYSSDGNHEKAKKLIVHPGPDGSGHYILQGCQDKTWCWSVWKFEARDRKLLHTSAGKYGPGSETVWSADASVALMLSENEGVNWFHALRFPISLPDLDSEQLDDVEPARTRWIDSTRFVASAASFDDKYKKGAVAERVYSLGSRAIVSTDEAVPVGGSSRVAEATAPRVDLKAAIEKARLDTGHGAVNPRDQWLSRAEDGVNFTTYAERFPTDTIAGIKRSVETDISKELNWLAFMTFAAIYGEQVTAAVIPDLTTRLLVDSVRGRLDGAGDEWEVFSMLMAQLATENGLSLEELRLYSDARNVNQRKYVFPKFSDIDGATGWRQLPRHESAFHAIGYDANDVRKYVHNDGSEVVFKLEREVWVFVQDGVNTGTFNYSYETKGHSILDIVPWLIWGTGPGERLTAEQRLGIVRDQLRPYILGALKETAADIGRSGLNAAATAIDIRASAITASVKWSADLFAAVPRNLKASLAEKVTPEGPKAAAAAVVSAPKAVKPASPQQRPELAVARELGKHYADPDALTELVRVADYPLLAWAVFGSKSADAALAHRGWVPVRQFDKIGVLAGAPAATVYKSESNEHVLVFRASDTSDSWTTDANGKLTYQRLKAAHLTGAVEVATEAVEEYPKVRFVGHGTGGHLAEVAMLATGNPASTVNATYNDLKRHLDTVAKLLYDGLVANAVTKHSPDRLYGPGEFLATLAPSYAPSYQQAPTKLARGAVWSEPLPWLAAAAASTKTGRERSALDTALAAQQVRVASESGWFDDLIREARDRVAQAPGPGPLAKSEISVPTEAATNQIPTQVASNAATRSVPGCSTLADRHLAASTLAELFPGRTLAGVNAKNAPWTEHLRGKKGDRSGGTTFYNSRGNEFDGRWRIDADNLCFSYRSNTNWSCKSITRCESGEALFVIRDNEGVPTSRITSVTDKPLPAAKPKPGTKDKNGFETLYVFSGGQPLFPRFSHTVDTAKGCKVRTSIVKAERATWTGKCSSFGGTRLPEGEGKLALFGARDVLLFEANVGGRSELLFSSGELVWNAETGARFRMMSPNRSGAFGRWARVQIAIRKDINLHLKQTEDRLTEAAWRYVAKQNGLSDAKKTKSGLLVLVNGSNTSHSRGYFEFNRQGRRHKPRWSNNKERSYYGDRKKKTVNRANAMAGAEQEERLKQKIAADRAAAERIWRDLWELELKGDEPFENLTDLMQYNKGAAIARLAAGHDVMLEYESVEFANGKAIIKDHQRRTNIYEGIPKGPFSWDAWFEATGAKPVRPYSVFCVVDPAALASLKEGQRYRFVAKLRSTQSTEFRSSIHLDCSLPK